MQPSHTSLHRFYVYPLVDDSIEIDINPADIEITTSTIQWWRTKQIKVETFNCFINQPELQIQCSETRSQQDNRQRHANVTISVNCEIE
jgi:peptide chain release factor 2